MMENRRDQQNGGACDHGGRFYEALGDDFSHLERIGGIINADVLDAWFEPSPKVLEALREHLPWAVRTSPPTHSEGLARTIAEVRGIPSDCVLPAGGSSALMYLALPRLLGPRPRALLLNPTYGEYEHILRTQLGADIDRFDLRREDGYQIRADKLAERLRTGRYDLFVLVNPNSPTGRFLPLSETEKIAGSLPDPTLMWVDETYIEYPGGEHSLEKYAARSKNVLVCKSMSKAYALSGMRCAYLAACPQTVRALSKYAPPWSVSLLAQLAAVRALRDPDYYAACWRKTAENREQLVKGLSKLPGVRVFSGEANFILCEFSDAKIEPLLEKCRSRGLYLRNTENMGENWSKNIVRVAVKSERDNARILEILREALNA